MQRSRIIPAAALACLALATAAAAQNPPSGRVARPRPGAQNAPPTAAQATGGGAAQYLAENPQVLQLTPVQVERVRKVSARVDSLNAPIRQRMDQLTGGRPFRELPPVERRRVAPQLQPLMQQLRANNDASLDSVEVILTPEQTIRLESLREDFKQRREARRAMMQPRLDSARARAAQRPPRP
jgi:hypothetical protein